MDEQMVDPLDGSESPPSTENSPSIATEDEEEYWRAFEEPDILDDNNFLLPEGCTDTSLHRKSYGFLQEGRETAANDPKRKYSWAITRLLMEKEMGRVGNGMKPRFYQEDCAEAFLLGINTGLICPTGSGKTEAFVLPLFADPTRKSRIIVVSPLNALQGDHAKRFAKYGITAAAVNGETYTDKLHDRLAKGKIRAIITSPEMMFKHPRFSQFFRDPDWTQQVLGVVIDEAHCVLEWGKEFRRDFDDVDKTRAYMASKPLFFCTATLTPLMLGQLLQKLSYPRQKRFILNLGCERHNITPIICRLKGPSDYEALDFVLDEAFADPPKTLTPTLIYAEERATVMNIWLYLIHKLPRDSPYRDEVDFLMATRDETVKAIVLARFLYGKVKILCSTEAAGMGLDARTRRVIQFGIPRSLLQWQQHAGRAGRDGEPAYALLLVEPSVFQVVSRKQLKKKATKGRGKAKVRQVEDLTSQTTESPNTSDQVVVAKEGDNAMDVSNSHGPGETSQVTNVVIKQEASEASLSPQRKRKHISENQEYEDDNADQAPADKIDDVIQDPLASDITDPIAQQASLNDSIPEYRKQVDEDMRHLCMTEKCRRIVTMKAFNSPPPMHEMTVACCDNCLLSQGDNEENPLTLSEQDKILLELIARLDDRLLKKPPEPEANVTASKGKHKRPKGCITHLKEALQDLRSEFWKEHYGDTMFSRTSILPDSTLATLASDARINTEADLELFVPDWDFALEVGPKALATIARVMARWTAANESSKRQKAETRKAVSAVNKIRREEERRKEKLAATAKKRAEKHADAVQNWTHYSVPTNTPLTPIASSSTTPITPSTPILLPFTQTQYTPPAPMHTFHAAQPSAHLSYSYTHMPSPAGILMPPPSLVPSRSNTIIPPHFPVQQPPMTDMYSYRYSAYSSAYPSHPVTPIRSPSTPPTLMYPTPPFTPVASSAISQLNNLSLEDPFSYSSPSLQ